MHKTMEVIHVFQPYDTGASFTVCMHSALFYLVDDIDAVINPLPPEDRVEVVEPVLQVVFSVAERDDDRHLCKRETLSLL